MADRSVFECGMCRELYDEDRHKPLNLPCGHVFCEDCLTRLSRVDDLKCPYHKQKLTAQIKDLPRLLTILKYLPASRPREFMCSLHPRKKVKFRCRVHDAYLCSDCIIAHTDHAIENFSATPASVKAQSEDLKKAVAKRCAGLGEARKTLDLEERKIKSNYETQVRNVTLVYDDAVAALNAKRKEHINTLKDHLMRQLQFLEQEKARLARLSDVAAGLSSRLSKLSVDQSWEAAVKNVDEIASETKRFEDLKLTDLPLFLFDDAVKISDSSSITSKTRGGDLRSRGGESRDMQKSRPAAWESLAGKFWICKECSMPNSPDVQLCSRCPPAKTEDFSRSLGSYVYSPKTAPHGDTLGGFEAKARSVKEGNELTKKASLKSYGKQNLESFKGSTEAGLLTKRASRGHKHSRYCSVRKRNNSF